MDAPGPGTLFVLLAALAAASLVLGVAALAASRSRIALRLRAIRDGRSASGGPALPHRPLEMRLAALVERLGLARGEQARQVAARLAKAGWRDRNALATYQSAKLLLPGGTAALACLFVYGLHVPKLAPGLQLAVTFLMVAAAAYAPEIYLRNAIDKRREKLRRGLPDALDLMVVCAEAGLSIDATFARVAAEIAHAAPELGDEIALAAAELRYLPDRRQALLNLAARVDLPAVLALANTLVQTERFGTPLSQSLRVLSAEQRNDRMMRAEEKAARLPAIMTVPLILFIMPALFVVLMGPAMLNVYDALLRR